MYLIALTGGIAAGKSTVAARLAALGAIVIDADHVAREAVEPGTEALAKIVETFGSSVLLQNGSLDRGALATTVFGNPEALKQLNAIVHPAVQALARKKLRDINTTNPSAVVVYDVPLLIEAKVDHGWNMIVVVLADEETRIHRLMSLRGFSREEAVSRIARQATDAERRAIADVIINTNGSEAETLAQTDALWDRIQTQLKDAK